MIKGSQQRFSVGIHPRQLQNALLGVAQLDVALLQERYALFVASEGFFQPDLAVFQLADDALQVSQGVFESGRRFRHDVLPRAIRFPRPGPSSGLLAGELQSDREAEVARRYELGAAPAASALSYSRAPRR